MNNLEFGVVGLGRMGGNLVLHALEKGLRVVGFDRGPMREDLLQAGLIKMDSIDGFREQLAPPRAVFLYIPAGPVVDTMLDDLAARLEVSIAERLWPH